MGNKQKRFEKYISVGTLNYCDIMNNPYEFYCEEPIARAKLEKISEIFSRLMKSKIPNFDEKAFKWKCASLDKDVRDRYSPFFKPDVGIY